MTAIYIAPRVPVVDPQTGICDPVWYRFFSMLFQTVGDGVLTDEMAFEASPSIQTDSLLTQVNQLTDDVRPAGQTFVALSDDVAPPSQSVFFSADDAVPAISALLDQVAMLRAEIDDLRKGTLP